jgi:Ca2+-binding EF-hand superfamily protein
LGMNPTEEEVSQSIQRIYKGCGIVVTDDNHHAEDGATDFDITFDQFLSEMAYQHTLLEGDHDEDYDQIREVLKESDKEGNGFIPRRVIYDMFERLSEGLVDSGKHPDEYRPETEKPDPDEMISIEDFIKELKG